MSNRIAGLFIPPSNNCSYNCFGLNYIIQESRAIIKFLGILLLLKIQKMTPRKLVFFDQVNGNQIEDRGYVQINQYIIYDLLRHVEVENVTCQDPAWMDTDSFYPDGKAMHKIIKSL